MSFKIISHQTPHHHIIENSKNIMDNNNNNKRQFSMSKHVNNTTTGSKIYVNNNNNDKDDNKNNKPTYEDLKRNRVVDKTYLLKLKEKRQRLLARSSTQPSTANVAGTKFEIGILFIYLINKNF